MTDRYVASTGSNTAPYENWTKAATDLLTVSALMGAGDVTYIRNEAFAVTVDTIYTFAGTAADPCWLISTADTAVPPTTVDSGAHITGSATAGVDITVNGKVKIKEVDFTSGGSTAGSYLQIGQTDESAISLEDCVLTLANTNSAASIAIGIANKNVLITKNCTFIFGNIGQTIESITAWTSENDVFAPTGIAPSILISDGGRGRILFTGGDFTTITGTLIGANALSPTSVTFAQCKMATGVTVMAAQTGPGHHEAFLYDCASGDTHYEFGHYNYWGNTTISTAIYMSGTDGASYNAANAKHSWKITGVNGTFAMPYVSPWIDVYNEATSAVTPRLEVLRDGSTTAYNNDQVWAEFAAKITTGSTKATINNSDRKVILAAAAAQASSALGAADWAGETTPWYGKLEPSAAITPAEIGHIRARVCVAGANTVYVNPKILGV